MPGSDLFLLPEKVLQFGTGVFIRGLIDYIIDKSNNAGVFNGRVVAVKSTDTGNINDFFEQDFLYTLIMRGVEGNEEREEIVVCSFLSRVLSAGRDWKEVLKVAYNPDLQIIISNTTEAGITLLNNENIYGLPPSSYPGKLLRFLLERYKAFRGSKNKGMVIIPTELIPDNAIKLKSILNELACQNHLNKDFILWMNESNDFCNSLVDRIVPGKPSEKEQAAIEAKLGYEDRLLVMSETFALWAIESQNKTTHDLLSFSEIHPRIFIVPNIDKFRELKLRLLNGSHNLSCAVAIIAGFQMVRDAMEDTSFNRFIWRLIQDEIASSIVSSTISLEEAREFGAKVWERYCNPHIAFDWLDICVQDTSKIRIRAIPIVLQHYEKHGFVPDCICLSFSSYILFMKSKRVNGEYIGILNGKEYRIIDDYASLLFDKWNTMKGLTLVKSVLSDLRLWEEDLSNLKGFHEKVNFYLENLLIYGFYSTFELIENSTVNSRIK